VVIVSDPSSGKVFAQRLGVGGFKHLHIKFLLTAAMEQQRRDCCHLCTCFIERGGLGEDIRASCGLRCQQQGVSTLKNIFRT